MFHRVATPRNTASNIRKTVQALPPKEVIRQANIPANGAELWDFFGGRIGMMPIRSVKKGRAPHD